MRTTKVIDSIKLIPELRRLASLTGKLQQYLGKMQTSQKSIVYAAKTTALVPLVFPSCNIRIVTDSTTKATASAQRLHSILTKRIEDIQVTSTETLMNSVSEHSSVSEKALKDVWREQVNKVVESYSALAKVAVQAKLSGSQRLKVAIESIDRQKETPPISLKSANEISAEISALIEMIGNLGLEGEAGKFLVAAAEGRANPQDLFIPAVKDLVERYKLWSLLSVKLG